MNNKSLLTTNYELFTMNYKPQTMNISMNNEQQTMNSLVNQIDQSMQNKPNLVRRRRIVCSCKTKGYGTDPDFWLKNPKANLVPLFVLALLVFFAAILTVSCKGPANAVSVANEKVESNQQASSDVNEPSSRLRSGQAAQKPQEPNDPNETKIARPAPTKGEAKPEHKHPAFTERIEERAKMVATQIKARDINDPNVLKAMQTVPRHAFVQHPNKYSHARNLQWAYEDHPLPIGFDQTISQPYIVAFMTEAMKLKPDSKVFEIGTGSGYQAAVCAELAAEVHTIEIVEPLAKRAEKTLKELGYKNVFVKAGDGYFGWPEKAPFDAIIGTAAAERIPEPLIEQLKPGGRMILPYETPSGFQYLVLVTKDEKGELHKENVMPVRFVPMTGEVQKKQQPKK